MFICAVTNRASAPGEPCTKVVTHTRPKTYFNTVDGETHESHGTEIVREISVSQLGLKMLKETMPELFAEPELPIERVWRKKPLVDEDVDGREWGV